MKTLSLVSLAIIFILSGTTTINATNTGVNFKDYDIEEVENIYLGKKVDNVWKLSYGSDEKPVTVVKKTNLEGTQFFVFSEHFEVCYTATHNGFGARKVNSAWRSVPKRINRAVINNGNLQRQRVITQKQVNDKTALDLIANYLPELINDDYKHLLN